MPGDPVSERANATAILLPDPLESTGAGCDPERLDAAPRDAALATMPIAAPHRIDEQFSARGESDLVRSLLRYDSAVVDRLDPHPRDQPEAFLGQRRQATASAWEQRFRDDFPDAGLAHALAVLWYWRAAAAALPATATDGATALSLTDWQAAWEASGAFWVMAVTTPATGQPEDSSAPAHLRSLPLSVKRRLIQCLQAGMKALAHGTSPAPATPSTTSSLHAAWSGPEIYQALLQSLDTELEVANGLAELGLTWQDRPLCCGPLLLERYDLLAQVREQLNAINFVYGVRAIPGRAEILDRIIHLLSPRVRLAARVREGRFDVALDALAKISDEDYRAADVRLLRGRISEGAAQTLVPRLERSKDLNSLLDQAQRAQRERAPERAIAAWSAALGILTPGAADTHQQNDIDPAVAAQQAAILLPLALCREQRARQQIDQDPDAAADAEAERGMLDAVADAARARALVPEDASATALHQYLKRERKALAEVLTERRLRRRYHEAIAAEDWSRAGACLAGLLEVAPQEEREALRAAQANTVARYFGAALATAKVRLEALGTRAPEAEDLIANYYLAMMELMRFIEVGDDVLTGQLQIIAGQCFEFDQEAADNPIILQARAQAERRNGELEQQWKALSAAIARERPVAPSAGLSGDAIAVAPAPSRRRLPLRIAAISLVLLMSTGLALLAGHWLSMREDALRQAELTASSGARPAHAPTAATPDPQDTPIAREPTEPSLSLLTPERYDPPQPGQLPDLGTSPELTATLDTRLGALLDSAVQHSARDNEPDLALELLLEVHQLAPRHPQLQHLLRELRSSETRKVLVLMAEGRLDLAAERIVQARERFAPFGLELTTLNAIEAELSAMDTHAQALREALTPHLGGEIQVTLGSGQRHRGQLIEINSRTLVLQRRFTVMGQTRIDRQELALRALDDFDLLPDQP